MLHWDEQLETIETVKPVASQEYARSSTTSPQLMLDFADTSEPDADRQQYIDDGPCIRRSRSYFELIEKVLDSRFDAVPSSYWNWQKFLRGLTGKFSGELNDIWQESFDEPVKAVAVRLAPDQPPTHLKWNYCPTYCPALRFGPTARGPPCAQIPTQSITYSTYSGTRSLHTD